MFCAAAVMADRWGLDLPDLPELKETILKLKKGDPKAVL
jgi:hypothetical protein